MRPAAPPGSGTPIGGGQADASPVCGSDFALSVWPANAGDVPIPQTPLVSPRRYTSKNSRVFSPRYS